MAAIPESLPHRCLLTICSPYEQKQAIVSQKKAPPSRCHQANPLSPAFSGCRGQHLAPSAKLDAAFSSWRREQRMVLDMCVVAVPLLSVDLASDSKNRPNSGILSALCIL